MPIKLTQQIIEALRRSGVSTLHSPGGSYLPDDVIFEPPCSLKWMSVVHSLRLGAFSYAVSGYYFACDIGRYCSFGEQVQVGRHGHPMHWISTSPFFYLQFEQVLDQPLPAGVESLGGKSFKSHTPPTILKRTKIGNDVWIGHGAFLLPGITVGHGAVIAAKSVVTKDVPPYSIVAGSPAKVIRDRFSESYKEALLASKWWEFAPWQLRGADVEDIPAFTQHVQSLRRSGEPTYSPNEIRLADLINK